ncbi:MAG: hypothetical protein IKE76_02875 [Clostridia bacterium]|nr:hypothetical protein [Clostridia bacterium]
MTTISQRAWLGFVNRLDRINSAAARAMVQYVNTHGLDDVQGSIDYAYGVATKYGEASAALAAEMYDAIAALMGKVVPAAVPAATASYPEVAQTVVGVLEQSKNTEMLSGAVSRLVKMAGEDTTLQNARRDRALVAWIPNGDTCAFCIALASRGWEFASAKLLKNGHARHVHSNCDCTHAVTWDPFDTNYQSYDPDRYREMYDDAEGRSSQQKINALRREFYAENKDEINAQKRSAYAKRIELNSSRAEEDDV